MLREFSAMSGGRLKIVDKSPAAFSEEEDEALKAGLQGVPVDAAGELVYFGLAGENAKGETQAIPFFGPDRESFLEYDLARLVYAWMSRRKLLLVLLTTHPLKVIFRAAMRVCPAHRGWRSSNCASWSRCGSFSGYGGHSRRRHHSDDHSSG